jgi:hypothetical protein
MNPEEIKNIVEAALDQKQTFDWWPIVLTILIGLIAIHFKSYIAEKGRNTATKEDIKEITTKIEEVKVSFQKEHSKFLDELQWNRKVQEQASRVAEYLALARRLEESSPGSDYERANQLSWELAMWLPEKIYKEMTRAIAKPSRDINELSVAISVRKLLLGDKAENLKPDDIAHHAPGIGNLNN